MSVAAKNLSSTLGLVAVLGSHSVALPRGWWQAQMIAAGYDCLPDRKGSVTMETLEDAGVELGGDEPVEQLVRGRARDGDAVDRDRARRRDAEPARLLGVALDDGARPSAVDLLAQPRLVEPRLRAEPVELRARDPRGHEVRRHRQIVERPEAALRL